MEFLKFTLEGRTAFFKKPDVNKIMYYSYGNIHKVALLGLFGAILGYSGYNKQAFINDKKNNLEIEPQVYPEFYSNLRNLKVAIIPKKYIFNKKKQTFNNSVGYASRELGGNLIVNEVWLENPSWDIYVALDNNEGEKLKKALVEKSFVYTPYLGKNDHFANILNVEVLAGEKVAEVSSIDSLFKKEDFKIVEVKSRGFSNNNIQKFKYQEKLPVSLEETHNIYELETFVFTNENLEIVNNKAEVYKVLDKHITVF